jgi:hypothetical protein
MLRINEIATDPPSPSVQRENRLSAKTKSSTGFAAQRAEHAIPTLATHERSECVAVDSEIIQRVKHTHWIASRVSHARLISRAGLHTPPSASCVAKAGIAYSARFKYCEVN